MEDHSFCFVLSGRGYSEQVCKPGSSYHIDGAVGEVHKLLMSLEKAFFNRLDGF
jgi:hypothetical protein